MQTKPRQSKANWQLQQQFALHLLLPLSHTYIQLMSLSLSRRALAHPLLASHVKDIARPYTVI